MSLSMLALQLLSLILLLLSNTFSKDIKVCINDNDAHTFVFVTDLDLNYENKYISHENNRFTFTTHLPPSLLASGFADKNCKVLKLPETGKVVLNAWPFVSTTPPSSLEDLNIPSKYNDAYHIIDLIEVGDGQVFNFEPFLGDNFISGLLKVVGGHLDNKKVLAAAMNEYGHAFTARVEADFTFRIVNLPPGYYRIFPIMIDNILHFPEDAKVFCPNYMLKEPHHTCVYTDSFNDGVDRLTSKSVVMNTGIDHTVFPVNVEESVRNYEIRLLGNRKESTISLLLRNRAPVIYAVELYKHVLAKNTTLLISQTVTHMESIDFTELAEGEYSIRIWRGAPNSTSTLISDIKRGSLSEFTVTVKPYSGTTYVGVDFDLLSKSKNSDYDENVVLNPFIEMLFITFGKIPVHILSWGLLVYAILAYYKGTLKVFTLKDLKALREKRKQV